jgi:DNA-binding PadR family transcriptional regulator
MPAGCNPADFKSSVSILDLFVMSLLDRGLKTPYDLLQAGVSLGSSIPALARMERGGLVHRKQSGEIGKRQRHNFSLSARGRKRVLHDGAGLLSQPPPADFDSVLRVIDIAHGIDASASEIGVFLKNAIQDRLALLKSAPGRNDGQGDQLQFKMTRKRWDAARLKAEARFLSEIAKSLV